MVQWHQYCTQIRGREIRFQVPVAALRQNGNPSATADTDISQPAGESIDSVTQLPIGEANVAADDGFAVGKVAAGGTEQVPKRSSGLQRPGGGGVHAFGA